MLPGDRAPAIPTLPAGTYPAWSPGTPVLAGEKVLFEGLPYEAKWANQGVSPATEATGDRGVGVEAAVQDPWRAERLAGPPA